MLTLFMRSIVCRLIIACFVLYPFIYYMFVIVLHNYIYGTKNQKTIPSMWANPTSQLHLKLSNTYEAHYSKYFF